MFSDRLSITSRRFHNEDGVDFPQTRALIASQCMVSSYITTQRQSFQRGLTPRILAVFWLYGTAMAGCVGP